MPASNNPKLSAQRLEKKKEWRARVQSALDRAKGNREKAAASLGMTKRTLYRWLRSMAPAKVQAKRSAIHTPVKVKAVKTKPAKTKLVAKHHDAKLAAKRKRDAENARKRRAARKAAAVAASA